MANTYISLPQSPTPWPAGQKQRSEALPAAPNQEDPQASPLDSGLAAVFLLRSFMTIFSISANGSSDTLFISLQIASIVLTTIQNTITNIISSIN